MLGGSNASATGFGGACPLICCGAVSACAGVTGCTAAGTGGAPDGCWDAGCGLLAAGAGALAEGGCAGGAPAMVPGCEPAGAIDCGGAVDGTTTAPFGCVVGCGRDVRRRSMDVPVPTSMARAFRSVSSCERTMCGIST